MDEGNDKGSTDGTEIVHRGDAIWFCLGTVSLGTLVGTLCGLSSAPVTLPLMAALFSLAGGGLARFLSALRGAGMRKLAGASMFGFCLSCTLFLLIGIWAREHQWLSKSTEEEGKEAHAVLKASTTTGLALATSLCASKDYKALSELFNNQ